MQRRQKKILQWFRSRIGAGYAVLAIILSVLSGCATDGGGMALSVDEPSQGSELQDGVEPSEGKEPLVARLGEGRDGFIITEYSGLDEASRRNFDLGVAMLTAQDYGQAIDLFQKVIEQSPRVTAPYIDLAIAYQRIGKPEQAEEHLKAALKLFPEHPVACNEYGLLYRKTGRFAEARAIHEKAIMRFPEYYPAHKNLGILCDLYLDDPGCALEHYEMYSAARPEDEQVKLWIADLRVRLGRD